MYRIKALAKKVIAKNTNTEAVAIDVANLQSGVYVVKTTINGKVNTKRFVKE